MSGALPEARLRQTPLSLCLQRKPIRPKQAPQYRLAPLYGLMSDRRPQSSCPFRKRVGHAILDVFDENSLRLAALRVSAQSRSCRCSSAAISPRNTTAII